ncbi:MAG: protease pro-enzyme activation domain-containing protein, partial [Thermoplasmata archaeon]
MIGFPASNQSRLDTLLANLLDPSSPEYRQYLSASEFDREFAGNGTIYAEALAYLRSQGVTGITTARDRLTLSFSASPQEVDAVFHTSLVGARGSGQYAPSSAPELPVSIARGVDQVLGLTNQLVPQVSGGLSLPSDALAVPAPAAAVSERMAPGPLSGYPAPAVRNGTQYIYASDLQVSYDELSLFQQYGYPTNMVIAVLLWTGHNVTNQSVAPFNPRDVYDYFNETLPAGMPHPKVYGVPLNGALPPGP